jgi:hypothetical protein
MTASFLHLLAEMSDFQLMVSTTDSMSGFARVVAVPVLAPEGKASLIKWTELIPRRVATAKHDREATNESVLNWKNYDHRRKLRSAVNLLSPPARTIR